MDLANLTPWEQLRAGRLSRRMVQLLVGLWLYGVSMALMIRSTLGQLPWDVLHYGVALHIPLSIGQVVVATSFLVLLLWIPLRQAPGLGTLANAVLIGVALDVTLGWLDAPPGLPLRAALMLAGVGLNALATALYIGAQLGPGPRDGLMTGWVRRSGLSIRLVRTSLEVLVVAAGWLLGGVVGVGTVLYAVAIGPLTQLLLPVCLVPLTEAEPHSPPCQPSAT
ncbi:MAG: hypothetical protein R2731_18705 [Nocardioides sp.]